MALGSQSFVECWSGRGHSESWDVLNISQYGQLACKSYFSCLFIDGSAMLHCQHRLCWSVAGGSGIQLSTSCSCDWALWAPFWSVAHLNVLISLSSDGQGGNVTRCQYRMQREVQEQCGSNSWPWTVSQWQQAHPSDVNIHNCKRR